MKRRAALQSARAFIADPGDLGETRVTARFKGELSDQPVWLQLEVSKLKPGVYRLTVAVRDLKREQAAPVSRSEVFKLIE